MKKKVRKTVCVVGLGYVGLPLAVRCVEKGYKVYGLDLDRKKINMINESGKYEVIIKKCEQKTNKN